MGLTNNTRIWLQGEGVTDVMDMLYFDDDLWDSVYQKALKPRWFTASDGTVTQAAPPEFSAMSLKKLKIATRGVKYYTAVGRALSAASMKFDPILKELDQQLKILDDLKSDGALDKVPKQNKNLKFLDWLEAFNIFLGEQVGATEPPAPLTYIIRENPIVVANPPPLATNHPYSTEHGSVGNELVQRMSHTHSLFSQDSKSVYLAIEAGLRSTQYHSAIKPFEKNYNGRDAYLAI